MRALGSLHLRLVAACALALVACGGQSEAPEVARVDAPASEPAPKGEPSAVSTKTPAARVPDVAALRIPTPLGWAAEYDAALESWTVRKPTPDATAASADRFYVDAFPGDAPADVAAYAAALETDPSFQDAGYLFVEIERAQPVAGGWLIVGTSKDTSDHEAAGSLSFVLLRAALGVYCHSGTFVDAKSRDEATKICMGIAPAAAARP